MAVSIHGPRIHIHWWNMGSNNWTDLRKALPSSSSEKADSSGESPLPKRSLSPTRDRKEEERAEKKARKLEAEAKKAATTPRGG